MTRKAIERLDNDKFGYSRETMIIKDSHLISDHDSATPYGESLSKYIQELTEFLKFDEPTIELDNYTEYGESYSQIKVHYFREMTPAELTRAQKLRDITTKKAKEVKQAKLERELKEYERLKKVFEDE